ncbi:response regulator [Xanthovirga aplysinae]|uniref:response regulator n=1 Tax=Xanthovirga aplysinae TaxID=2529853 RepID=UPI0012BB4FF3|nr:response regulator [Xanthovirga aplysinae]MTI30079.1 response regulator transcription factor [Xanthovirga aplysinae]
MEENKRKILVVDNDHYNMRAIVKCFKDDFQILYGTNGLQGFEIAMKELPDIIIMDWEMPIMNGIEAIIRLKSDPLTREIPIVMATGVMTSSQDLKTALEAGAIDFIRKPFDELELTSRTLAALRLSHSHQRIKFLMAKEKELLQEQLSRKERELTLQAIQINEKNQFLTEVTEQIEGLRKRLDGREDNLLLNIKKNLHYHIDADKAWENFLLHFESVHPQFFSGLKQEFPTLTNNELRLSAYIKIGMDNKEMAQISGIGLGTIKSNLNRLKKKMNLEANDSIRDFLIHYGQDDKKELSFNSFLPF